MNKEFLIINNGTSHLEELRSLVGKYGNYYLGSPDDVSKINAYRATILSGGSKRYFRDHLRQYPKTTEWIRAAVTPVLGICLGFELIADAYGIQLQRMDDKYQGIREVRPSSKKETLFDKAAQYLVYEGHRWLVQNTVQSAQVEILARSTEGVEVIRVKGTNVFGCQFHPEVSKFDGVRTDGEVFFKDFLRASKII